MSFLAALKAAEAFRRTGILVAPRSGYAQTFSLFDGEELEQLVVGAVNLSFAMELYLKAILLLSGTPHQRIHELEALFNELPSSVQEHLRKTYRMILGARSEEEDEFSLNLLVVSQDENRMEGFDNWPETEPEIEALLKSHNNAFRDWRYGSFELKSLEGEMQFNFRAFTALLSAASTVGFALAKERGYVMQAQSRSSPAHWRRSGESASDSVPPHLNDGTSSPGQRTRSYFNRFWRSTLKLLGWSRT